MTADEILDAAVELINAIAKAKKPKQLTDLSVTVEPVSFNGRSFIRLLVWFESLGDSNFAGAHVWQKGYGTGNVLGDPDPSLGKEETLPFQLLTVVDRSPATLLLEATGEDVVIGVEAINSDGIGAGFEAMLTQVITLS